MRTKTAGCFHGGDLRYAIVCAVVSVGISLNAQVPTLPSQSSTVGEATKNTYTRFLELAPAAADPLKMPIPKTEEERAAFRAALTDFSKKLDISPASHFNTTVARTSAMDAVKAAPSRPLQLKRLLKNQEERTAQPDALKFLAETPLLAEIAASDDKDFAQVIFWNEVALNVTANDHTPLPAGSTLNTNPAEQIGPAKTSRALAIVHVAMFEAMNATHRQFKSYQTAAGPTLQEKIFAITGFPPTKPVSEVSTRTAIAYAAYYSLLGVYPKKSGYLAPILSNNLTEIGDNDNQKGAGQAIGTAAAQAVLEDRALDGSEYSIEEPPVQQFSSPAANRWKKDPLNADPDRALGALWHFVRPFVGTYEDLVKFRPPTPPPLDPNSQAFKDVKKLGGDPTAGTTTPPGNADRRETPTERTDDQTFIGKFWAYDATALLCAPPRLYNMVATSLALKERNADFVTDATTGRSAGLELARYLALVNVALADAGVGAWEAKYYYRYPRPVTGIRDTAPVGSPDRFWTPLGAPVSNAQAGRVNFTPPFPSYPSGHAVFGAALFEVLRLYYGTDAQTWEFISDEYNGKNRDAGAAQPRPRLPKTFTSFTMAEQENGVSRIYLGIHWPFDAEQGEIQGRKIGGNVFNSLYQKFTAAPH